MVLARRQGSLFRSRKTATALPSNSRLWPSTSATKTTLRPGARVRPWTDGWDRALLDSGFGGTSCAFQSLLRPAEASVLALALAHASDVIVDASKPAAPLGAVTVRRRRTLSGRPCSRDQQPLFVAGWQALVPGDGRVSILALSGRRLGAGNSQNEGGRHSGSFRRTCSGSITKRSRASSTGRASATCAVSWIWPASTACYVWVRVGPWDHGEVRNGGLPDWLLHKCATRAERSGLI